MPELPDITIYLERLDALIGHQPLEQMHVLNPFVLRSVAPTPADLAGRTVVGSRRIGKRIALEIDGGMFIVIHLMIAGRLKWRDGGGKLARGHNLAAFDFPNGRLLLTEAGSSRRASIHITADEAALAQFDRGGLEPLEATLEAFTERLRIENHTLKRSLTDPRLFSGIGNAYSDEILHRARLSPIAHSTKLTEPEIARLYIATRETLVEWIDRTRAEVGDGFPEKVTAFREGMAVHGRFGDPCPVCNAPVQRIRYASNETNYCARCQTGGRLLADRALSRLLGKDWPRSIDEVE
jgi:formamidopyrimidine-DNA glycosylase